MAKVTITIEDQPGNRVKVVCDPSAETMLKKIASHGRDALTSAEGYAFLALNTIRDQSKSMDDSRIVIPVPRARKI